MLATLRDIHLVRTLRRAFRGLPVELHMKPASDPTLLFAGIIYGPSAFIDTGLYRVFWDLKRALFYYGDLIIEAYIAKFGLPALREMYAAQRSDVEFCAFPEDAVRLLGLTSEHDRLKILYGEAVRGCGGLAALSADGRGVLLQTLVSATNAAIESTFHQEEWEAIDLADPSQAVRAIAVVGKIEKAKNVRVVTTLCSGKRLFREVPQYPHDDEEIVARTSRWFTLLDDLIDLRSDLRENQPNTCIAYALEANALPAVRAALDAEPTRRVDLEWFRAMSRIAAARYEEAYTESRRAFIETFPVLPRWLAFAIERRARRKAESPF